MSIVPQAVRIVIPPTGNEFITLLKLTSLASVISLQELLTSSEQLAAVQFNYLEAYSAAIVYYLVIVSVLMLVAEPPRADVHVDVAAAVRASPAPAVPAIPHDAR